MKDDLFLEGKKYISARRASQISGYNSDYLGQLCRAEKLDCKLISRTWFVTEKSLREHHKSNGRKKVSQSFELRENTPQNSGSIENLIEDFYSENEKVFLDLLGSNEFLPTPRKKIVAKVVRNFALASLTAVVAISVVIDLNSLFLKQQTLVYRHIQNSFGEVNKNIELNKVLPVASLEKIIFVREKINDRLIVFKNSVAIFFSNIFERTDKNYLARESKTQSDEQMLLPGFEPGDKKGSVMVPVPAGDASSFLKVKNYLQNSFSDEIEVVPDDEGLSGVIKPVFADPSQEEYLYVMVPIR